VHPRYIQWAGDNDQLVNHKRQSRLPSVHKTVKQREIIFCKRLIIISSEWAFKLINLAKNGPNGIPKCKHDNRDCNEYHPSPFEPVLANEPNNYHQSPAQQVHIDSLDDGLRAALVIGACYLLP